MHKLLIIDDEVGILDMITSHFSLRGFEVRSAADGGEGIKICADFKPDVILLDLKMKQVDGDQAVPHLRRMAPEAVIFVVSAYQDDVMQKRLAGLPIDEHFEKPVPILELEHEVRAALAKRAAPHKAEHAKRDTEHGKAKNDDMK